MIPPEAQGPACSLSADELRERRTQLLPGLVADAVEAVPMPDGARWRFDRERTSLSRVAEVVEAESGCCGFLRFVVRVEPERGPLWLEVSGPPGTAELLDRVVRI